MKKTLFVLSLLISCQNLNSQAQNQDYNLKFSREDIRKKCDDFFLNMSKKPNEVQFGLSKDDNNNLYFSISNKEWLDVLINSNNDGIAIDVVSKDQYGCQSPPVVYKEGFYKGTLMPPMFKKDLKRNSLELDNGLIIVKYGILADELANKDVEFNLIFIQNKFVCQNMNFFDIKRYKWDLLDMGMYMDTLISIKDPETISNQKDSSERFSYLTKTMKFTVPFGTK